MDLDHRGHGDVVGDGEHTVYIARERQNHFVPLMQMQSRTTSASGRQSGMQWRTVPDATSSTASGSVAVPAGGARENSKSAKSSAPGFIICNDIIEDNNIEHNTILYDLMSYILIFTLHDWMDITLYNMTV